MRRESLTTAVSMVYSWTAITAFAAIAVETIVIYPNVFHDAPRSLTLASEFFSVTGPADFFPPMGAATALIGVVVLILAWPYRNVRWWAGGSLTSLALGEYLYSVLFFWPRNEIMFDEGVAVHSAEVLQRTATEFEIGHWGRLAMSGVTAALAFVTFLRLYRHRLLARAELAQSPETGIGVRA